MLLFLMGKSLDSIANSEEKSVLLSRLHTITPYIGPGVKTTVNFHSKKDSRGHSNCNIPTQLCGSFLQEPQTRQQIKTDTREN